MQPFNKNILRAIIFCILIIGIISILNYLLVPWASVEKAYMAFDEKKDNIDLLIIGDSLEQASFDKTIMSQELGCNVDFMTQAASFPECHYYMLLDSLTKQHHIKTVILGFGIMQNYQTPFYDDKMLLRLEFLKRSCNNKELFLYAAKNTVNQRYLDILMPFSNNIANFNKIGGVLQSKKDRRLYLKNKDKGVLIGDVEAKVINEDGEDFDMGVDPNIHKEPRQIGRAVRKRYLSTMRDTDKKYLEKIKALCDANNIKLIVIASSVPARMQEEIPMMKTCMADTQSVMNALNINYIDTSNEKYFPNSCDTYNYRDWVGHYNVWYRSIHTKQVCEYLLQKWQFK